ncbi:hypothetical protein OHA98_40695 [Streptomyces sp. NBC_00654]|uniref:hypothetical protein n=1 Tax=Streptomyces sp. NBC_00654 TaxID=2975799 RepID=UPI002258415E|nr:hypothetical protein [Streptomyces sp. NBC_00654]MCX4970943.1 hypothetical protein [Streptomyces sp. NBC_00654]
MNNGDISLRLAARRDRRIAQLGDAAARWGRAVPEDPGIAELADLLGAAAADAPARADEPGHTAKTFLTGAVEDLKAAARLGGLLPAVTLWHLHRAIEQERAARLAGDSTN